MRSGKLDRQITIERKTITQDEYGDEVETWDEFLICKAKVMPMRAWERFRNEKLVSEEVYVFTIRYYSNINVEDRIVYENKYWDIIGKAELGRRRGIELTAEVIT